LDNPDLEEVETIDNVPGGLRRDWRVMVNYFAEIRQEDLVS